MLSHDIFVIKWLLPTIFSFSYFLQKYALYKLSKMLINSKFSAIMCVLIPLFGLFFIDSLEVSDVI